MLSDVKLRCGYILIIKEKMKLGETAKIRLLIFLLSAFSISFTSGIVKSQTDEQSSIQSNLSDEVKIMADKSVKRNFFQRLFGIPATKKPKNPDCWNYSGGKLTVILNKAPELSNKGGAIQIEGGNLTERVLIIHGDGGQFHAFHNKCGHGGRRLDPVPGGLTVQCCSVGKSTYDYNGKVLSGSSKEPIKVYPVALEEGNLIIALE